MVLLLLLSRINIKSADVDNSSYPLVANPLELSPHTSHFTGATLHSKLKLAYLALSFVLVFFY